MLPPKSFFSRDHDLHVPHSYSFLPKGLSIGWSAEEFFTFRHRLTGALTGQQGIDNEIILRQVFIATSTS